jgi:hypothetical protein
MKTRKWIWWTLTIVLSLVVLGFTGLASYRIGVRQGTSTARVALKAQKADCATTAERPVPPQLHGFEGKQFQNFPGQNFGPGQGFDGRNFNRFDRRGGFPFVGFPFLGPLFGLVSLAVLVLLIWLGYKLIKNSGWRLTRVTAEPAPAVEEEPEPKKRAKK